MISKRGILLLSMLAMGYTAISVKAEPPTEGTSVLTEDVEINVDPGQGIEVNTGKIRISVPRSTDSSFSRNNPRINREWNTSNPRNQLSTESVEGNSRCSRSNYHNSQSTQTSNGSYNVQRSTQSNLPRPTCN